MKRLLAILRLVIFVILIGLVIFFIYRLVINIKAKNSAGQLTDSAYQQVDDISSSTNVSGDSQNQDASTSDSSSEDSSSSSSSDASSNSGSSSSSNSSSSNSSSSSSASPSVDEDTASSSSSASASSGQSSNSPEAGISSFGFFILSLMLSSGAYIAVLRFTKS